MTAGYRALADMAHAQGMRIWFCELTPWKGYTRNLFGRGDDIQWSPEYDALRLELNAWFQGADCPADGYIPLDALADPNNPDGNGPDGNNPDGNNPDGNNPDGSKSNTPKTGDTRLIWLVIALAVIFVATFAATYYNRRKSKHHGA